MSSGNPKERGFIEVTAVRTFRCVRFESKTHETVLLYCMTDEVRSGIQQHQSSAFLSYIILMQLYYQ